jgi:hypothetical protein
MTRGYVTVYLTSVCSTAARVCLARDRARERCEPVEERGRYLSSVGGALRL